MEQKELNQRADSCFPTISNYLMEESNNCYEHEMPDNGGISKILGDKPDHDYSSEMELDEDIDMKKKFGEYLLKRPYTMPPTASLVQQL